MAKKKLTKKEQNELFFRRSEFNFPKPSESEKYQAIVELRQVSILLKEYAQSNDSENLSSRKKELMLLEVSSLEQKIFSIIDSSKSKNV